MKYIIEYRMYKSGDVKEIEVDASNRIHAWNKATFTVIPYKENEPAYSTWVAGVRYQNGRTRWLNNFEGKPY